MLAPEAQPSCAKPATEARRLHIEQAGGTEASQGCEHQAGGGAITRAGAGTTLSSPSRQRSPPYSQPMLGLPS